MVDEVNLEIIDEIIECDIVATNYISQLVFEWVATPAYRNSPGVAGQMSYDDDYFYLCVHPNVWARTMLLKGW